MRLFWVLIAAFLLVGGVVLGASWYRQGQDERRAEKARAQAEAAQSDTDAVVAIPEPVTPPSPSPLGTVAARDGTPSPVESQVRETAVKTAPTPVVEAPAVPVTPVVETPKTAKVETPTTAVPTAPARADIPKPKVPDPARNDESPPAVLPGEQPKTLAGFEVDPATFVIQDNALVVDGKFIIRGDGTADHPYQVPWEMLTSVGNMFDPRSGKKAIPGRVAFLDGKFVRIAGYVSFPLMVKQPRELLSMLNQWDGCCIGVPPTPYDAIEVSLAKPIVGNDVMAVAGAVTGEFHVKPYVVGDWLVGLYVMDKGGLVASDWNGAGGF